MNVPMILYILGWILKIEGILMLPSFAVGLIYREGCGIWFLIVGLTAGLLGAVLSRKKPGDHVFYLKEGCVITALSWLLMSLVGCLPFLFSGEIPSFVDALFETVSGFTTTGASVLNDVEALSYCMLFWRSFTHWIGGMGVLVFLLAVVQMTGGSHMNLMKAESPGPAVAKMVPKVAANARILYGIYIGMTLIQFVLLLFGEMNVFEAFCTAMGTAGTGGFGFRNDSMASFSPYIQWVITVFMILFAVNFNVYSLLLFRKWKQALNSEEVKAFFLIIVAAVAIITANLWQTGMNFFEVLRTAAFQVASLISSTGFATADFDRWPELSRLVLVMVMFVGACAGSTGGGIKVSRLVLMVKTILREFLCYIHPKSVRGMKMDGRPVEKEVVRGVTVYLCLFSLLFAGSIFLVTLEGYDLVTNFTAVLACFNNIGPGLELVGPSANFSFFNPFTKVVLMFDMLAGRLELFPMLLLFHPGTWKGTVVRMKKK